MATKDEIDLVLARLAVMPANLKVSIGETGAFTKQELMEHVKKCAFTDDEIGELVVKAHMLYLKSFKDRPHRISTIT